MRLLRVIASMDPSYGGPCQGIRNSIPELEKNGIHNEVACMDDPGAEYLGNDPFKIHALGPGKTSWGYSKKLLSWLVKNISSYDVILVHGLWQYYSYAVYKSIRLHRKSSGEEGSPDFYIMPHGMLDPYFQKASDRKLKAIRNWIYWKLIEKNVVNDADGLLFTCKAELELARQTFHPYHPKKEINVGYGIIAPPPPTKDMADAFLDSTKSLINKPFFLFLSRIHPKKGIDILIDAYKEWAQGIDDSIIPQLVIAGPGIDSKFGQNINQMVGDDAFLDENVHFTGMLKGLAKWGAFYNCEAFILPSHQENFGIAVVEAMACGKPVLISDKVNIWKEIKDAGAGMVSDDTQNGTLDILKKWSKLDKNKRDTMCKNARRIFEDHFAITQVAKRLLSVITSDS